LGVAHGTPHHCLGLQQRVRMLMLGMTFHGLVSWLRKSCVQAA
jgi:hypothetical protein